MSIRTSSVRSMTVVAVASALLLLGAPSLFAPTAVERGTVREWFGMTGITRVQTARLNVVLIDGPDVARSNLMEEMFFFDDQGVVVARSGNRPLTAGKAVSHDLLGACPSDPSITGQSCVDRKEKFQFRAGLVVTGDWDKNGLNPLPFVAATLELLDNETHTTHVVLVPAVQRIDGQKNKD
jgi:hypothetical protein